MTCWIKSLFIAFMFTGIMHLYVCMCCFFFYQVLMMRAAITCNIEKLDTARGYIEL